MPIINGVLNTMKKVSKNEITLCILISVKVYYKELLITKYFPIFMSPTLARPYSSLRSELYRI